MGFGNMMDFNKAMLTKTTWRLHNDEGWIWFKVLKGLYYPRGSLMEAKNGARPSWAWTSILAGRDVLKQEGDWQVRKGDKIRALKDAWIPELSGYRIRTEGRVDVEDNIKVAQLIGPGRRKWNLSRVQTDTTERERMAIRSIHPSNAPGEDKLIWLTSTDGVARSKLVYRRLRELSHNNNTIGEEGSNQTAGKRWKTLWRSESISKVKNFLWRATEVALLVNAELEKRGFQIPTTCPFCNEIETVSLAVLSCGWAKMVWFGGMGLRLNTRTEAQWEELLKIMHDVGETYRELGRRKCITGETMAWKVWKERCRAIHNGENPRLVTVIRVTTSLAEETWRNRAQIEGTDSTRGRTQILQSWRRLMSSTIKMNYDAAWEATTNKGDIGVVAQD